MKRKYISCFFLISCLLFGPSLCMAGPSHALPYHKNGKIKERLVTLRNWKLMEEFNLSGDKANRVFNILKGFDDRREDLILKRRRFYGNLKAELQMPQPSEEGLKNLIQEITGLNIELARLQGEEVQALATVFTVTEQARYLLFSERFAREARRLLARRGPGARDTNYLNKRQK